MQSKTMIAVFVILCAFVFPSHQNLLPGDSFGGSGSGGSFEGSGSGGGFEQNPFDLCDFVQIPPFDDSALKGNTKLEKVGDLVYDLMKEFDDFCEENDCNPDTMWCYGNEAEKIAKTETMKMLNKTVIDICGSGPECFVDKKLVDSFFEFCVYPDEWWVPEIDEDSSLTEVAEVVVQKLGEEFDWCQQNGCGEMELSCKLAYVYDEIKYLLGQYSTGDAWSKCYDTLAICNYGEKPEENDSDDWEFDDMGCPNEYMTVRKDMTLEDFAIEAIYSASPAMECSYNCWEDDVDCLVDEIFEKISDSFENATLIDAIVKNCDGNEFCKIFEEDIDWEAYDYSECEFPEDGFEFSEETTIGDIQKAIGERLEENNQFCHNKPEGKCSEGESVCLTVVMYGEFVGAPFDAIVEESSDDFWNIFWSTYWSNYWYDFWMEESYSSYDPYYYSGNYYDDMCYWYGYYCGYPYYYTYDSYDWCYYYGFCDWY